MLRWRIYYGDGTVYDAKDGSAYDAPALNAQMIAVADQDHGWYLCRSNDFYWYLPATDDWQGGDIFGLWDYLSHPGQKRVLFGRTIDNATFAKILARALDDPDIPQKTGWRPNEHRPKGALP